MIRQTVLTIKSFFQETGLFGKIIFATKVVIGLIIVSMEYQIELEFLFIKTAIRRIIIITMIIIARVSKILHRKLIIDASIPPMAILPVRAIVEQREEPKLNKPMAIIGEKSILRNCKNRNFRNIFK